MTSSSTRSPSPSRSERALGGPQHLSADVARRIALSAQGLADPRPRGRVDRRHVRRLFARIGVVQVDSVNVLVRSQELPLFARLGPHPRQLLPAMAADGEVFEYWGHMAAFIPADHHRLFRWRMAAAYEDSWWRDLVLRRPDFIEEVYDAVVARGPVTAADLRTEQRRKGTWWDWDDEKRALELLFYSGRVTARRRSTDFARVYDLPERMLPAAALKAPTPDEADARKELLLIAARALGIATDGDLADYHRQRVTVVRPLLAELVEAGALIPARVEGWPGRAYLDPQARNPRRVSARALLSPFDSLVFDRRRTERIFGFHYRIEIYTPAPKRVYGYYVLPFLLGEEIVARVDLKADRARSALLVPAAFTEPGMVPEAVAEELALELRTMAGWLGLDRVVVGERGGLAAPLQKLVR
jgi:uncharacterized protein